MKQIAFALLVGGSVLAPMTGWADDSAAIAERNAAFEAAFNAKDAAGVAALYTEDAVLLPPDMAMVSGRDGAEALWAGFIEAGAGDLDLTSVALEVAGDLANEIGTFSLTVPDDSGGTHAVNGKYVVVWKRDDAGVWSLHWDIWNGDPSE